MNRSKHAAMWLLLLVVIVIVVGCRSSAEPAGQDQALADHLNEVALSNGGAGTDLRDLYEGTWTRVAVFPAFSTNEMARDALGIDFPIEETPSQARDSTYLVAFADESRVMKWFVLDPPALGFGQLTTPIVVPRDQAQVSVGVDKYGGRVLQFAQHT